MNVPHGLDQIGSMVGDHVHDHQASARLESALHLADDAGRPLLMVQHTNMRTAASSSPGLNRKLIETGFHEGDVVKVRQTLACRVQHGRLTIHGDDLIDHRSQSFAGVTHFHNQDRRPPSFPGEVPEAPPR